MAPFRERIIRYSETKIILYSETKIKIFMQYSLHKFSRVKSLLAFRKAASLLQKINVIWWNLPWEEANPYDKYKFKISGLKLNDMEIYDKTPDNFSVNRIL